MADFDTLFAAASAARAKAHAPYSHYAVGAAILADDGKVYAGCNVENASFPEGWCAETTAIGHLVMGAQAEGGLRQWLQGSVSRKVLADAKLPLFIAH